MRTLLTFLLLSASAIAADKDFNGRWDIKVSDGRVWWLEVNGAGTSKASGSFVTAFDGDRNEIPQFIIKDGRLRFEFSRPPGPNRPEPQHFIYTARLAGDKLEGEFQSVGAAGKKLTWTGVRAPVINDQDDGSWKPAKPVKLFNGKDLARWLPMVAGKELGWKVESGIMKNVAGANNLISQQKFFNFKLHVEFRLGAHTNSGIGLRDRYEIQILEDYGRPPNTHSSGALYSRVAPSENASKPPGEWQTYDITLIGRWLTLVFNGKTVLNKVEVEGLTAIAHDCDEALPGPMSVQGDHGPVEIRDMTVTPLTKGKM